MKRRPVQIATGFAALALLVVSGAALARDQASEAASSPIRLAKATVIVEVDATVGDAGLQFFLDGDPWRSMQVSDPNGRTILDLDAEGRLRDWGLTELFSETNEPPFDEVPLAEFKARFPAGRYTFVGTTTEGRKLVGNARLSHDIPDGPEIVSPADGATVDRGSAVVRWNAAAQPRGVDVVGYRIIVTREDPLRVFSADLPASADSVAVPREFLEPGAEYELEIQAIEESGNQTFTTSTFTVN
jgi:hypothetical protein